MKWTILLRYTFVVMLGMSVLISLGLFVLRTSPGLPRGTKADKIIVNKEDRELVLLSDGKVLKRYRIALGAHPRGHKLREGDERTPEGVYRISGHNPQSRFHLSLRISYPNAEDRARAQALGVSPGGDIMIHGLPKGLGWVGPLHRLFDWTDGCIAVTNSEIEEIYRAVPDGIRIQINP
ncbi:hypothetical protein D6833_05275 [Candidatus Parcubacteria bacterium]|nr:MAG: hypothetical protein D6833_05275 [Candidatus Parcubacteria bacterium]